ncbi:MAG: hypothetical protein RLZZ557_1947 [Bacteroidota bacterium]
MERLNTKITTFAIQNVSHAQMDPVHSFMPHMGQLIYPDEGGIGCHEPLPGCFYQDPLHRIGDAASAAGSLEIGSPKAD